MANNENMELPLTIASLCAIRERKRQLIAPLPTGPSGLPHGALTDCPVTLREEDKEGAARRKLVRAGQVQHETSDTERGVQGEVQKPSQNLSIKAQNAEAECSLCHKTSSLSANPALCSVVLGKRPAPTPLQQHHGSYTASHSLVSDTEIADVVAEDADPVLVAMWQVIPDMQKEVVRDIDAQIVMPTVVEYLNMFKRRKLGTLATEHDVSIHHCLRPSRDTIVAQMLPNSDMSPSSRRDFTVGSFLQGIKDGTLVEENVPLSFSIVILMKSENTTVHSSVRTDAYTTIFKALSATLSLGRDPKRMADSQARGAKAKWTCMFKKAMNEICEWPAEGQEGQYTCSWCMRHRRPCVVAIEGTMSILPLAPSVRIGRVSDERAYCAMATEAMYVKPVFFKKSVALAKVHEG